MAKTLHSQCRDLGLIPGQGTSGEGNGNPLQCSCLENPRDGGASWAAVYGVAQSQTRLKRRSSSSSSSSKKTIFNNQGRIEEYSSCYRRILGLMKLVSMKKTNLRNRKGYSIVKNKDIALLTKIRIVKAIVFPVVTYVCESWTIRKTESRRSEAFKLWC